MVRQMTSDNVGESSHGKAIIAGDAALVPGWRGHIPEKRDGGEANAPELLQMVRPGDRVRLSAGGGDVLVVTGQRSVETARKPQGSKRKGSLSIRDVVDDLRAKGKKAGMLKVITYRPFPKAAILKALAKAKEVAVVDKSISLGMFGPLYTDITSALASTGPKMPKVSGFVLGLGGRDITKKSIFDVYDRLSRKQVDCEFIGLKKELLVE